MSAQNVPPQQTPPQPPPPPHAQFQPPRQPPDDDEARQFAQQLRSDVQSIGDAVNSMFEWLRERAGEAQQQTQQQGGGEAQATPQQQTSQPANPPDNGAHRSRWGRYFGMP